MVDMLTVDPHNLKGRHIRRAAEVLRDGGVIIYPTDTIYGLGCDITNREAVERVQLIKGRSHKKPMSFVCADLTNVSKYAHVSNHAYRILKRFLPGPYTFVLPATRETPRILQTKQKTVGLRVPSHPVCMALLASLLPASVSAAPGDGKPRQYMVTLNVGGGDTGRDPQPGARTSRSRSQQRAQRADEVTARLKRELGVKPSHRFGTDRTGFRGCENTEK